MSTSAALPAADALTLRMTSLLLRDRTARHPKDVAGIVTWFGAMQAQDLASGLWSLGARMPGAGVADVRDALERREAVRTWPMRGTVHLVPPCDARWMLDLTGVRALAGAQARRDRLGISQEQADRAVDVLGAALAGGGRLTRAGCLEALAGAGIAGDGNWGYHLLWYASQLGVTCVAPNVGTEQTFVLLDEWAPDQYRPDRDEALGTIALRYFRSHGPTTRQDFAGWTGLTAADARLGITVAGAALATVRVGGKEMYLDPELLDGPVPVPGEDVLVLPGFDEYLLGFKDRSLMVADEHKQAIIPGGNGVFQATVVRGGRVVGTWKKAASRVRTAVTVHPLVTMGGADRAAVEAAFEPYGRYTGMPLEVRWPVQHTCSSGVTPRTTSHRVRRPEGAPLDTHPEGGST